MGHDPNGLISRRHFLGYKDTGGYDPVPLNVLSANPHANWFPVARPLEGGAEPGPQLVIAGPGYDSLGIDPTDPSTWEGRGYRQCAGMIGRFNTPDDWLGISYPGGSGVRPS